MPVVYIDVVWAVNLVMDAVLLFTTGWIAKRKMRPWRVFAGALVGAMYSLILFVPSWSWATTWPGKALVSLVMIALVFPTRNWLQLARLSALYYFVSFVLAGAAIALHFAVPGESLTKGVVLANRRFVWSTSLGGLALVVAIPLSFALIRYVMYRVKQVQIQSGSLYEVFVTVGGKNTQFTGLVDTGNQLRDPVSRRPVCLVDAHVMQEILPEELHPALQRGEDLVMALSDITDKSLATKFALIPFRGAGGVTKMTIAIRPDHMELEVQGARKPAAQSCLLAVHTGRLSNDNRFQAILHTQVITGDDGLESNLKNSTKPESQTENRSPTVVDSHPSDPGWRL